MSQLPEGWQETKVGQIAKDISYGFTTSASSVRKGPQFLRITDIQNGRVDWTQVPFCKTVPKDESRYKLNTGDIVFARTGATTGKSFLIKVCPEAVFASYLIRVTPADFILPELLAYFFQTKSYWQQITDSLSGSAQPNCNARKLSSLRIPLPPLNEQHRIVEKLKKLLTRVEAAQERLATIPRILKRFRKSVLAAACSGRLTADWRKKNHDAVAVSECLNQLRKKRFERASSETQRLKLKSIYNFKEESNSQNLPQDWLFVALDKLCESFDYGTSSKSQNIGRVPVLRMCNIQNGVIDWRDLVYTSDEQEILKYKLAPNTVLFNRTNSPELVGKTAIYLGENPAIFAGYLIRINNYPVLDSAYLNHCLNTEYARGYCLSVKTDGVSQSNINAQKLAKFELPFCAISEQQEIVRRVDVLFKTADELEERYKKAKAQVDKLTPSILAKAFRGELVPQDPNDEPASVLLERVRQQRNGTADTKMRSTTKQSRR